MHFNHCSQPNYIDIPAETINNQRWYTTPFGKFPSVTTVLGDGEKEWLQEWVKSMGEERAEIEKNRCAARGENVHLVAERYLKNDPNPVKNQGLEIVKLFNQIKLYLNRVNNIRAQEIPLYSADLRLAGRTDVIAEYQDVLSVIDFKTSNNTKTTRMVEDYFLQSTAYAIMYNEMFNVQIDQIVVIIAVERGIAPLVFVKNIEPYIEPLIKRINTFYANIQQSQ